MKRRSVKDTAGNRAMLDDLGISYIEHPKRKRVMIKVSNSDMGVIQVILPDAIKKET